MSRHAPIDILVNTAPVVVAVLGIFSFFEMGPAALWTAVSQPAVLLGVALLGALLSFLAMVWRYEEHDRAKVLAEELRTTRAQLEAISDLKALEGQAEGRAVAVEETLAGVRIELAGLRGELDALGTVNASLKSRFEHYRKALDGETMLRIPHDQVRGRLRSFQDELTGFGEDGEGVEAFSLAVHDFLRRAYTDTSAVAEFTRREACTACIQSRVKAQHHALELLLEQVGGLLELDES